MRILFVTDYFYPHIGGVEKLFLTLCKELVKSGHEVTYITWKYKKELEPREDTFGIKILRVSSPTRMLFPFFAIPIIIKYAKEVDLIHTSTYSSALGAWIGSKFSKTKIVVTVHEVWRTLWKALPFLSLLEKTSFRWLEKVMFSLKFDHYIAVSENTKKELLNLKIKEDRITRIYNGINYQVPKWQSPNGPFTFTYFGRAGVSKGLDLLLNAAEEVTTHHSDIRFKFIVSPQSPKVFMYVKEKANSEALVSKTQILSNLSLEQLHAELLSSNCVIIPSYSEGFGFTAAEASAMGIPILSSGQGSLNEVVSGRVIVMETFDHKGMVMAMEKALDNDFETVPLKKFLIEEFVKNHLQLYSSINGE